MKKSLLALAVALVPSLTWAQGAVLQNGPVVKFDLPGWIQDKTIMSGGKMFTDNFRGFNTGHFFDNHGLGVCTEDALTNGPYHQLCLGHDTSGNAQITVNSNGGASLQGLNVVINNSTYSFPGGAGLGNMVGPSTSTPSGLVVWNNALGTLTKDGGNGTLSGTSTVPFLDFANLTITDTATNTVTGTNGGPKIDGMRVRHTFANGEGNRNATFSVLEQTGTTPLHASTSFFTSNFAWTHIATPTVGGNYYAYGGLTELEAGGPVSLKGVEFDSSIHTGASASYHVTQTLDLVNGHASRGTGFDAAFDISSDGSRTATYKNGIVFGDPLGWWAFANDSTLIGTNAGVGGSPARTAQYGIDMSGVTFSIGGAFLKSSGFSVDGFGITTINPPTTGSTNALIVEGGTAGGDVNGGMIAQVNTGSGAVAPNKFMRVNAAGDWELLNSAYSAVILGATDAGLVKIGAGGLANNGSVATVLGSVGPVGASTAVRKWIKFTDGANTYFLPGF
jgi:hypothetical protein